MAKKTKPESVGVAMTDEAIAVQSPTEIAADPTLLGVQVPLSVTLTALKHVAKAWRACLVELGAAARAKLLKSGTPDNTPATTVEA